MSDNQSAEPTNEQLTSVQRDKKELDDLKDSKRD